MTIMGYVSHDREWKVESGRTNTVLLTRDHPSHEVEGDSKLIAWLMG